MGCDMHCFVQKKNKEGQWRAIHEVEILRDYDLFGIINNVRREHLPPMAIAFIPTLEEAQKDGYQQHPTYEGIFSPLMLDQDSIDPDEEGEPNYLGEHSFCLLDFKMMVKWKHWHQIEDDYTYKQLLILVSTLLRTDHVNYRYIIGFDN
jgi:hypothetical protein